MPTQVKSNNVKSYIYKIIVLFFMFGFGMLPPFGEMTQMGMQVIGIFIGAIVGWSVCGQGWTSITGLVAIGLSDAYPTIADAFVTGFASQSSIMILGTLLFSAYMMSIDLTKVILGVTLNLKIAKKGPYWLAFCFFLAGFVIAVATIPGISIILLVDLYKKLADAAGVPLRSKVSAFWLIGIAMIAVMGDIGLPFRPTTLVFLSGYESIWGAPLSYANYCVWLTIPLLLCILVYLAVCKFIFRIDLSDFSGQNVTVEKIAMTEEQKFGLVFLLLLFVLLIIPGFFPNSSFFPIRFLNELGTGGIMLFLLAFMGFFLCKGNPVLNFQEISKYFMWEGYFLVVFFFTAISLIASPAVGLSATLTAFFQPLLSHLSPMIFVFVCILLAAIITNFMGNVIVAVLFMTLIASCQSILPGINTMAASLAIMMASFIACASPAANVCCALMYSYTDVIDVKQTMGFGWKVVIAMAVFVMLIYFPVLNFIL